MAREKSSQMIWHRYMWEIYINEVCDLQPLIFRIKGLYIELIPKMYVMASLGKYGVGSQTEPTPYTAVVSCYLQLTSAVSGRDGRERSSRPFNY